MRRAEEIGGACASMPTPAGGHVFSYNRLIGPRAEYRASPDGLTWIRIGER